MAGVDMDLVRQKQAEVDARSNYKDVPFLKFKEDGIYVVRLLPPFGESTQFWMEFQKSFGVGPNRKHITPLAQFGQDCPLQKRIDALNKAGDELSKKEAQKIRPKSRVSMVVVERKNEAAGPQIWETNLDVFRDVLTIMSDPDFGDITHPDTGTDLQISYTKEGRTGFSEWTVLGKRNASPLTLNEQQKAEWLGTDWMAAARVGQPTDAGYIEAVLAGTEIQYNEARKAQRAAQGQQDQQTQQTAQPSAATQMAPTFQQPAPPPLAAAAPGVPSVPVVSHKFLAGTKLWQVLNGNVVETTVEAVCQRLKTEKPEAVQVMAYDQAGGWQSASALGFVVSIPAPVAPSAPAVPPPPMSPPTGPPAMPHMPPPPQMGGSGVPFDVPPSEASALSQQLAAFGTQTKHVPVSEVAKDIAAALGR